MLIRQRIMKKLHFILLLIMSVSVFSACEKQADPEPEYSFPIDVISSDTRDALRGNRVYYLMDVNTKDAFLDEDYIQSIDDGPSLNGYEGISVLEKYDTEEDNVYKVEVWYRTDNQFYIGDVYIKFIFQDSEGRRSTSSTVSARFFE